MLDFAFRIAVQDCQLSWPLGLREIFGMLSFSGSRLQGTGSTPRKRRSNRALADPCKCAFDIYIFFFRRFHWVAGGSTASPATMSSPSGSTGPTSSNREPPSRCVAVLELFFFVEGTGSICFIKVERGFRQFKLSLSYRDWRKYPLACFFMGDIFRRYTQFFFKSDHRLRYRPSVSVEQRPKRVVPALVAFAHLPSSATPIACSGCNEVPPFFYVCDWLSW